MAKRHADSVAAPAAKKSKHATNDIKRVQDVKRVSKQPKPTGAVNDTGITHKARPYSSTAPTKAVKFFKKGVNGVTPGKPRQEGKLLSRQDRKKLKQERLSHKKNYPLAKDLTSKWEKIRQHNISKEDRAELVNAVMEQVKGRVVELASNHVTSRVLQACAKYGTAAQRAAMLNEVLPELVNMAKSPYGHFTVRKLISSAPKASIPALMKAVRGQVPMLLRHPSGCTVVEELYDVASAAQRDLLTAEFYSREFVLFDLPERGPGGTGGLASLWETFSTPKKRTVLQHMATHVIPIVEKGLVHSALAHRLVHDYMLHAPGGALDDIVSGLSGEIMMRYVHTREGAAVGCMVLAYGTPKDRKKTLKAMKPHVKTMAVDEYASLVLITALQVVDDTALARKCIIAELQNELTAYATHRWAHRVLLALLAPTRARHWAPSIRTVIQPPIKTVSRHRLQQKMGDGEDTQEGVRPNDLGMKAADGDHWRGTTGMDDNGSQPHNDPAEEDEEGLVGKDGVPDDDELGLMDDEFDGHAADSDGENMTEDASADQDDDSDLDSDSDQEHGSGSQGASAGARSQLGASKKEPAVRRTELLSADKAGSAMGMAGKLLEAAVQHAVSWLCSGPGSAVVEEVALGGEQGTLTQVCGGLPALLPLHRALANAATAPPVVETDATVDEELDGDAPKRSNEVGIVNFFGSRAFRRILLAAEGDGSCQEAAVQFAEQLWTLQLQGHCKQWVGSHADKVLAALLMCKSLSFHKEVKKELSSLVPGQLLKWAHEKCHPPQTA